MDRSTSRGVLRVASAEIDRAMRTMRVPGFPRPYYLSNLIRDGERWRLAAKYGALKEDSHERTRSAFVDVRIGSWRHDQVRDGGLLDNDQDAESYDYVSLPHAGSSDGLRHGLWRLTDARYREAVEAYFDKRSRELTYRDEDRHLPAFERREPLVADHSRPFPEVDPQPWRERVERTSALLRRYPDVKDAHVEFEADHLCRIFADSTGARAIECHTIWSLECYMWLLSPRGDGLPWTIRHTVADPAELPDDAAFRREIRSAVRRLRELAEAPTLRGFCGPALLEPVPAGLLVHEAVGHRLEGSRLLAAGEGQTFKDSVGTRILPEFLSIRDDPSLARWGGRSLVGHYRFDDEGVPAQDARLVVDGVLREFLSTRVGLRRRHRSNGHARAGYHQRPISRMALTVVEATGGLDDRSLRRRFLEEIRRQNAPFGVRIAHASSGETATEAYDFQAFLGEINLATKVFPDGREQRVRGVNFVGTPLNALRTIVAAGRRAEVDNAYCGSESGFVPVSTISPALVVSGLELQAKADAPYSPYSLPLPWE